MLLSLSLKKSYWLLTRLFSIAFLLLFGSLLSFTAGQSNVFRAGAREASLANTGVALKSNWAMFHNPAAITHLTSPMVGVHYSNQYIMEELSTTSVSGTIPLSYGGFGLSVSYFGTSAYNEQKYAFGYAHKLGNLFAAGITLDYFNVKLPEPYESSNALAGEIGLLVNPVDNLLIGCHLYNITNSKYTDYPSESLQSFFSLGATWQTEIFLVTSQVYLDREATPTISAGSEVYLIPTLAVRIGASTNEQYQYTFGVGYRNSRFNGDLAFTNHPTLGFSSHISFNYAFISRTK